MTVLVFNIWRKRGTIETLLERMTLMKTVVVAGLHILNLCSALFSPSEMSCASGICCSQSTISARVDQSFCYIPGSGSSWGGSVYEGWVCLDVSTCLQSSGKYLLFLLINKGERIAHSRYP